MITNVKFYKCFLGTENTNKSKNWYTYIATKAYSPSIKVIRQQQRIKIWI